MIFRHGTRESPQVLRWVSRHPRFRVHFIPSSLSWLNLVVRRYGDLAGRADRRGSFRNFPDLIAAIEDFSANRDRDPKLFTCRAKAADILTKIDRCRPAPGGYPAPLRTATTS